MQQKNSLLKVMCLAWLACLCWTPVLVNAQFVSQVDCYLPTDWEGKETKLVIQPLNEEIIVDTAFVTNRHVKFMINNADLCAAYIWIEGNQDDIHFLVDSPKINIAFDPKASVPVVISGSPSSELWQQQQAVLKQLIEASTESRYEYTNTESHSDSLWAYEKMSDSLNRNYQKAFTDMISQHPVSASSWYLFATYISSLPYQTAADLFNKLSAFSSYPSYKQLETNLVAKQIGKKVIDFVLPDLSGKPIRVSQLKGKLILVDFANSHLSSSQWRHSLLKTLYKTYHSLGLEVLTVSQEFNKKSGKVGLEKESLPWLVTMDTKESDVLGTYRVDRLPDNLLLNADKTVIGRDLSIQELKISLSQLLDK